MIHATFPPYGDKKPQPEAGPQDLVSQMTPDSSPALPLSTPLTKPTKTCSTGKERAEMITHETGGKREAKDHKTRPDLICTYFTEALGYHLSHGAVKLGHGERNWEQGLPDKDYLAGIHRHLMLLTRGCVEEDHCSAIAFNLMGLRRNAETGKAGGTPINVYTLDMWKEKMNVKE